METRQILAKYVPLRGTDQEQFEYNDIQNDRNEGVSMNDNIWKHTNDLDVFFKNVYLYHKDGGIFCKLGNKIFEVLQVVYVAVLTIILATCINYKVLFKDEPPPGMDEIPPKLQLSDVWRTWDDAKSQYNLPIWIFIISSSIFTLFKLGQTVASIPLYYKIKKFYEQGLKINDDEMDTYTWEEVKSKIIILQAEQQFCIQKEHLNELDIHHRILRFTNYFVGMVNHNVINLNLDIPCIGKVTYLSRGLKYNLDLALFWGPWSPFECNWRLHNDFKRADKLHENAEKIRKTFRLLALVNFILMIFILMWQMLYFFYSCAQFLKNDYLKFYKWSLFGETYLRHFNELDHELQLRLSKGFNPSMTYVKTFPTKRFITVISHLSFFIGAPFIILAVLTAWSAEVMQVEHLITIFTILGISMKYFYDTLPSEACIHDPERHLKYVLHYAKYAPEHWIGKAHTPKVKNEFSKLFEHKLIYLFEDFVSPIITPYILGFKLPNNAVEIAEFLRKYTVEVDGVGDVCSFAHLKVYDRRYTSEVASVWMNSNDMQSFNRLETSLLSFTMRNPNWIPDKNSAYFISNLQQRSKRQEKARSTLINDDENTLPELYVQQLTSQHNEMETDSFENNLFESLRNFQRDHAASKLRDPGDPALLV